MSTCSSARSSSFRCSPCHWAPSPCSARSRTRTAARRSRRASAACSRSEPLAACPRSTTRLLSLYRDAESWTTTRPDAGRAPGGHGRTDLVVPRGPRPGGPAREAGGRGRRERPRDRGEPPPVAGYGAPAALARRLAARGLPRRPRHRRRRPRVLVRHPRALRRGADARHPRGRVGRCRRLRPSAGREPEREPRAAPRPDAAGRGRRFRAAGPVPRRHRREPGGGRVPGGRPRRRGAAGLPGRADRRRRRT